MHQDPTITIRVGKPLRDFLASRPSAVTTAGEPLRIRRKADSTAINQLAARHAWLMQQSIPVLSGRNWIFLIGLIVSRSDRSIEQLERVLSREGIINALKDVAGDPSDWPAFVRRAEAATGADIEELLALSPAQKLAAIERVERLQGGQVDEEFKAILDPALA